jgi:hypothetical protein
MSEVEKSGYQIVLEGLERTLPQKEFETAKNRVIDEAFEHIFRYAKRGIISWKRSGPNLDEYIAEATITNAKRVQVDINIYFVINTTDQNYRKISLLLGSKSNAPCLSVGIDLYDLYEKLTGEKYSIKL